MAKHRDFIVVAAIALGFGWRVWLAHTIFFNSDEAWHYAVANQGSLHAAYRASLTLAHPPLMVFVLYFWKHLGTSDLMLRLPGVLAGTAFCWIFYKWLNRLFQGTTALWGGIFAAILPPMIALSAELRQYSFMLMFAVTAGYFLEVALEKNSRSAMVMSCLSLYCAMLSHYSAFLFAATLGIYAAARIFTRRPGVAVTGLWVAGQVAGIGIGGLLYITHISKLNEVYPVAQPLHRFGDFYLSDWYFHPGRDHLLLFLYRGTFGVFRFIFGQTGIGQIAAVLFFVGVSVLLFAKSKPSAVSPRLLALLLLTPFLLSWIAVVSGLYPYGRTRQCLFLAVFAFAGVSVALSAIAKHTAGAVLLLFLPILIASHAFGTLQGRDMLPPTEQRHGYMEEAMQLLRVNYAPGDVILTDKATSYQLRTYLCRKEPVQDDPSLEGFDVFHCHGFRVLSTGSNDGALTPANTEATWQRAQTLPGVIGNVWIVQGGWAKGLGEELLKSGAFPAMQVHTFGRYLEVLRMPPGRAIPTAAETAR